MKPKTQRDPCGCTHDGRRWLTLCAAHQAEADARHQQAARDYRASHPQPAAAQRTDWLEG